MYTLKTVREEFNQKSYYMTAIFRRAAAATVFPVSKQDVLWLHQANGVLLPAFTALLTPQSIAQIEK
jgi:hypothetical protein